MNLSKSTISFYALEPYFMTSSGCGVDIERSEYRSGEAPTCDCCGRTIGLLTWMPPRKMTITSRGAWWPDVMCGIGAGLIVSDRFKETWTRSACCGIASFEDIQSTAIGGDHTQRPPCYWEATLLRSTVRVDERLSGIRRKARRVGQEPCSKCGGSAIEVCTGLCVDLSTWSGEDIFRPENAYGSILLSERLIGVCSAAQLRHAIAVPSARSRWDYRLGKD